MTPITMPAIAESERMKDLSGSPTAHDMVEDLADDHERLGLSPHVLIEPAEHRNDPTFGNLAIEKATFHGTAARMLRPIAA